MNLYPALWQQARVVEVINGANSVFENGNWKIFDEIGILPNAQTNYIASHVDPAVTQAEWDKLCAKNKPWPGLLIKILSQPRRAPKPKEEIERAERRKYAEIPPVRR